jgi:hypothetical protein
MELRVLVVLYYLEGESTAFIPVSSPDYIRAREPKTTCSGGSATYSNLPSQESVLKLFWSDPGRS